MRREKYHGTSSHAEIVRKEKINMHAIPPASPCRNMKVKNKTKAQGSNCGREPREKYMQRSTPLPPDLTEKREEREGERGDENQRSLGNGPGALLLDVLE